MSTKIKSLGVLCSGGDAPGMNAAVRAVVRTALGRKIEPFAIYRGYAGLLNSEIAKMDTSDVGQIIQRGGTAIKTSRCPEFHEKKFRKQAYDNLNKHNIDALIVIGGEGSFNGAYALHDETGLPIVGIPGTIDNDISGTDYTIGFDSAVQSAVESVDKIRDTASSHSRVFLVEVMGRHSPAIALHVGVAAGAENVIFPDDNIPYQKVVDDINHGLHRQKTSSIVIVAESKSPGRAYQIKDHLKDKFSIDSHVCVLGHTQRGGRPTAFDRFIASRMGNLAVKAFERGEMASVTSYVNGEVSLIPLSQCLKKKGELDHSYDQLLSDLSI